MVIIQVRAHYLILTIAKSGLISSPVMFETLRLERSMSNVSISEENSVSSGKGSVME